MDKKFTSDEHFSLICDRNRVRAETCVKRLYRNRAFTLLPNDRKVFLTTALMFVNLLPLYSPGEYHRTIPGRSIYPPTPMGVPVKGIATIVESATMQLTAHECHIMYSILPIRVRTRLMRFGFSFSHFLS